MITIIVESLLLLLNFFLVLVQTLAGLVMPPKRKNVADKVILLTGSAQGIGKEMATMLHQLGAKLALVDINEKLNSELVSELQAQKRGKVIGYQCDLSKEQEIVAVAQKVLADFGHVDILVNNAGIVRCAPLDVLTSTDIRRTFDVNVFSQFWLNKQLLPSMIARKSGQVVAISSIAGLTGTANLVDYCSSKFAVTGMMEALEYELDSYGHDYIKLTTICPLAIATGMFKKPKTRFSGLLPILTPKYTAEMAVDAILTNKSLVTIPASSYYAFYLVGKLMPDKARKLLRDFCGYGVDEHKQ